MNFPVAEIGVEIAKPGATSLLATVRLTIGRAVASKRQNLLSNGILPAGARVPSGSTDEFPVVEIGAGNSQTWGHESIGTVRLTIGRAVISNGKIHFQWDFACRRQGTPQWVDWVDR
jgi:hypothetical protein